jgi:asparagine synthase (glutamine-hydrolysing)
MCGFVGVASDTGAVPEERLLSMRDTLVHRGPDHGGHLISADGRVALGFRRLSIIDLHERANQPMPAPDGSAVIVFNGEIYNHRALRDELEATGVTFRGNGDTEVLLHAYLRWGIECLDRMVGMFAFAIHDVRSDTICLARDRAGEKPLFYIHAGGRLLFASELKALLADPSVPRRIDPRALDCYLAYGYVPAPLCMLEGVRKLPPAHVATYDIARNTLHVARWWELPAFASSHASHNELESRAEALLGEAVAGQLEADVPVGVLLSGGVDSSLVTALAVRHSPGRIRTFTVGFPGHREFDERSHARLVANHFGTDHTELELGGASVELLPGLARQFDEPIADSSMLPTYLVAKAIRKYATVAIGGDGGDELFGGYPHHAWLQRQAQVGRMLPGFVLAGIAAAGRTLPAGIRGRNYLIGAAFSGPAQVAQANIYFDAALRRRLTTPAAALAAHAANVSHPDDLHGTAGASCATPERWKAALAAGNASSTVSTLQQSTRADFLSYLPEDILVKVDRASMLASLEVRAPFLDHRLVEFAFRELPDSLRATPSQRKILLRRLAERLLPPGFNARRKQGFTLPLAGWFGGEWGAFTRDVLAHAPLYDGASVQALLDRQVAGGANEHRLFSLTMLELWRREYRIEDVA